MENLSKNELERQERLRASQWRFFKRALVWVIIVVVVAGGSYGLVLWGKQSQAEKPGVEYADQGRDHIPEGQTFADYNSNPPTSGPHWPQTANWGIYEDALPDERLLHNLEHGGIWISYKDSTDEELIGQLRDITDDYTLKVILTPRPQNDAPIAVAAWGRVLKLEAFDRGAIIDFIRAFINRGPEQVPY